MGIKVQNIRKQFKDFTALHDVSLEVKTGELIALLGPSGSGKTTLLRIIAGMEFPDGGTVVMDGENTTQKSARDRKVGFVFQHYALFKHMTVFENVAFGLRVKPKAERLGETAIRRKVMELLKLVHLEGYHRRYPSQLSGGQRQRVALARALAVEPKVLLLDEPFGALDARVRKELRRWLRRLHDEIHITSIFVTHDQEEAMEVADRVVVMSNGQIEQVGTPAEVYHKPANVFVYDFLGNYNRFEGWKDEAGQVHVSEYDVIPTLQNNPEAHAASWWSEHRELKSIVKKFVPGLVKDDTLEETAPLKNRPQSKGKPVKILVRPHEMTLTKTPENEEFITGTIVHINPAGALAKIDIERRNGEVLQAEVPQEDLESLKLKKGDTVYVRPKQMQVFE